MERKKLALTLIVNSLVVLIPIFFIAGVFPLMMQIWIYVFVSITMLLLLIAFIMAQRGTVSQSARLSASMKGGTATAKTPLAWAIGVNLFSYIGFFTDGIGMAPGGFVVPPGATLQATVGVILSLASIILAFIAIFVFKDPRKQQKKSSTWT